MTTVLDPTSESRPEQRELVLRPESLDGLTTDSSIFPNRVATFSSTESRKSSPISVRRLPAS